ncbi:MAG: hypothetical protein GY870_11255 [archaeon]|nr:hypothetical protein [archaeon]
MAEERKKELEQLQKDFDEVVELSHKMYEEGAKSQIQHSYPSKKTLEIMEKMLKIEMDFISFSTELKLFFYKCKKLLLASLFVNLIIFLVFLWSLKQF